MTDSYARPDRTRLRPEIRTMLEGFDELPPVDFATLPPVEERAAAELRCAALWGPLDPVAQIEDLRFRSDGADIRTRIYRPENPVGTVLFFHGGGWVLGSIDTHDGPARVLVNSARANVVSVEYRKAPEHPFPAAIRDCDAALDWLLRDGPALGLDTSRIVVGGESAGGNLAAVLALHARDRGIKLRGQALIYPVTDTDLATGSYRAFADGFYLGAAGMNWFINHYLNDADRKHPDAAPLHARNLSAVAPALVVTADHDPLRDEGRAYAAALVKAGNDVTFRELPGTVHGLWLMNSITPAARELVTATAGWIAGRLLS